MQNKFIENMIPVEVFKDNNKTTWFMDISNLSLSELIILRKELLGFGIDSIRAIDAIIHKNTYTTYEKTNFNKRDIEKSKKGYRNSKILTKMRKKK